MTRPIHLPSFGLSSMLRKCALGHVSKCSPGLSREHYISSSVLDLVFDDGKGIVQGTSFLPMPKMVGKNALTARTLCEKHNNGLSPIDAEAARIVLAIQDAENEFEKKSTMNWTYNFSGITFELWLLKVVFGMWYAGAFAKDGKRIPGLPPQQWGKIIMREELFPDGWGMYLKMPDGYFFTTSKQLAVTSISRETDGKIVGAQIEIASIPFFIILGKPDDPTSFGIRRPASLTFRQGEVRKQISFDWSGQGSAETIEIMRVADAPVA